MGAVRTCIKTRSFAVGGGAGIVFKRTPAHPAAKIIRSEKEKMEKNLETKELLSIALTSPASGSSANPNLKCYDPTNVEQNGKFFGQSKSGN